MHLGLGLHAQSALHGHSVSGGSQPGPTPMAPIPGILDAANVVILGASIMQSGFGANGSERQALRDCAAAAGFTGVLLSYAVSGHQIANTRTRFADAKADLSTDEGNNLYIAHTGGNNVSSQRPYPGGEAAIANDYDALIADITATDTFLPLPLTKRLYGRASGYTDPNSVNPADPASAANGSLPYNENILHPRIASLMPDWMGSDGMPVVNPYEVADRFPDLTGSDGIHGYGASIARYILAKVAGRAHGIARGSSRAGKSILYDIRGNTEPNDSTWGQAFNSLQFYNNIGQNYPWLFGAGNTDGSFDPHILIYPSGSYQNNSSYGPDAFARIPDTRFHHAALVERGLFVQGSQEFTLNFEGLTPGDQLTMTAVGVRSSGAANRKADATLNVGSASETLTLDAATSAPANQITFSPVTVPADGSARLSLSVTAGSTFGYLHAVALDFS